MNLQYAIARLLVQAANTVQAAESPQDAQKVDRAIKALAQAQSNVASSVVRLQSAAKAIDKIEPLLKTKRQESIASIESFRKFYGEIVTKLNELTSSLASVNSELMAMSSQVETPAPEAPAEPAAPAAPPAADPSPAPAAQPSQKAT